jgi:hypothetical protein
MKDIFRLIKLTLEEKNRLILSFISTIFVAFFTYVFVNLVQPIMDKMLKLAPAEPVEKFRFLDFIYRYTDDPSRSNIRERILHFPVFFAHEIHRSEGV